MRKKKQRKNKWKIDPYSIYERFGTPSRSFDGFRHIFSGVGGGPNFGYFEQEVYQNRHSGEDLNQRETFRTRWANPPEGYWRGTKKSGWRPIRRRDSRYYKPKNQNEEDLRDEHRRYTTFIHRLTPKARIALVKRFGIPPSTYLEYLQQLEDRAARVPNVWIDDAGYDLMGAGKSLNLPPVKRLSVEEMETWFKNGSVPLSYRRIPDTDFKFMREYPPAPSMETPEQLAWRMRRRLLNDEEDETWRTWIPTDENPTPYFEPPVAVAAPFNPPKLENCATTAGILGDDGNFFGRRCSACDGKTGSLSLDEIPEGQGYCFTQECVNRDFLEKSLKVSPKHPYRSGKDLDIKDLTSMDEDACGGIFNREEDCSAQLPENDRRLGRRCSACEGYLGVPLLPYGDQTESRIYHIPEGEGYCLGQNCVNRSDLKIWVPPNAVRTNGARE